MSRYIPRIDVNKVSAKIRRLLQPGQHVIKNGAFGRWVGFTQHGSSRTVVSGRAQASKYHAGAMAYFRENR